MTKFYRSSFLLLLGLLLPCLAHAGSQVKLASATPVHTPKLAAATAPQKVDNSTAGSSHMISRFNRKTLRIETVLVSNNDGPSSPLLLTTSETTKHFSQLIRNKVVATVKTASSDVSAGTHALIGRLARLTAYWAGEGDYYTSRHVSSTGIHLHGGHCAVDPSIIPYGSVVEITGVGQFLAVDTGSAVVSRTAAREAGHSRAERGALVIDLYFEHRRDGQRFAANGPKFASVSWWSPASTGHDAKMARSMFADENWNMIFNKQL